LYEFLSTPAGLGEWFADNVDEMDGVYYFNWSGTIEKAELLDNEPDKFIRFRWLQSPKLNILNLVLINQKLRIKQF
jgi:uncharacterized protein YndB with AHSA1/START domain